ncbi:unnamed protein product [Rangifer tarandus platyrhynchus]|uniref:Uncharacterized protein n=1 Tax=Rangifer tarandus platyrhynchus TaxID=3082113 RepID=A0ABN8ZSD0_RANTA|nr:unnamed protein product [Rangifer tarandus platyrhynchus]
MTKKTQRRPVTYPRLHRLSLAEPREPSAVLVQSPRLSPAETETSLCLRSAALSGTLTETQGRGAPRPQEALSLRLRGGLLGWGPASLTWIGRPTLLLRPGFRAGCQGHPDKRCLSGAHLARGCGGHSHQSRSRQAGPVPAPPQRSRPPGRATAVRSTPSHPQPSGAGLGPWRSRRGGQGPSRDPAGPGSGSQPAPKPCSRKAVPGAWGKQDLRLPSLGTPGSSDALQLLHVSAAPTWTDTHTYARRMHIQCK